MTTKHRPSEGAMQMAAFLCRSCDKCGRGELEEIEKVARALDMAYRMGAEQERSAVIAYLAIDTDYYGSQAAEGYIDDIKNSEHVTGRPA